MVERDVVDSPFIKASKRHSAESPSSFLAQLTRVKMQRRGGMP